MAPVLNRPRCWLRPCLAALIVAVSTSSDADDVRALARRYDSAGCRRAIERTWHRFPFHEMAKSNRRSQEARRYELATGHRSMYVRVQKAGSRLLWFGLDRILGSPGNNRLRLRFCHPGPCSFAPERVFAWTVVRDPWDKALSAYADIHHHSECFARHFPNITALACDTTEADATRRFGEFLRTVTSGALACGESFHLWPSALLMDVIRPRAASGGARFGAVARLEHLRRDLPRRAEARRLAEVNWRRAVRRGRAVDGGERADCESCATKLHVLIVKSDTSRDSTPLMSDPRQLSCCGHSLQGCIFCSHLCPLTVIYCSLGLSAGTRSKTPQP